VKISSENDGEVKTDSVQAIPVPAADASEGDSLAYVAALLEQITSPTARAAIGLIEAGQWEAIVSHVARAADLLRDEAKAHAAVDDGDSPLDPALETQLANWFQYHPPAGDQAKRYELIRGGAHQYARLLAALCPPSADRSDAFRKLRECVFAANASIACGGR
jgi:hypothetical protein